MTTRTPSKRRIANSKTGEKNITEWVRGDTLFYVFRIPVALVPHRKAPPKKTFRVGDVGDPDIESLKVAAMAKAVAYRDCTLAELEKAAADREARADRAYPITFAEAVKEYGAKSTIKSIKDRESLLKRYANPTIGTALVSALGSARGFKEINRVLELAALKRSRQTVIHIRHAITAVLRFCFRREQLDSLDVLQRVELPEFRPEAVETRPREILTDDEFIQLVTCDDPRIPLELRVMAVCSRTVGGMRISDLLAWSWDQIDTDEWKTAHVPRPKTRRVGKRTVERRHVLPEIAVRFLKIWWMAKGRPVAGPVFGKQRRRRIGEGAIGDRRERGAGYARRLRAALLVAGVTRHSLHNETPTRLPVDFHSFRRAYCTALAGSGVNAQTSMALAGHSSMVTHQRYLMIADSLSAPDAAIPMFAMPTPGTSTTG